MTAIFVSSSSVMVISHPRCFAVRFKCANTDCSGCLFSLPQLEHPRLFTRRWYVVSVDSLPQARHFTTQTCPGFFLLSSLSETTSRLAIIKPHRLGAVAAKCRSIRRHPQLCAVPALKESPRTYISYHTHIHSAKIFSHARLFWKSVS